VFTLIGEGGLHLNVHELQTIRQFALRVKIIVLNNGGYHSIRMTQKAYFDGHCVGSGPESGVSFPSIEGIAALYGLNYYKIVSNHEIDGMLADFVGDPKAAILEVVVDPMKPIEPKIASSRQADGSMVSRPLEDMTPLLDRNELRDLMFIPILDM
jgi:acetolactate synthase-1/2/3 large subunit